VTGVTLTSPSRASDCQAATADSGRPPGSRAGGRGGGPPGAGAAGRAGPAGPGKGTIWCRRPVGVTVEPYYSCAELVGRARAVVAGETGPAPGDMC
jgi:hypothetical protein